MIKKLVILAMTLAIGAAAYAAPVKSHAATMSGTVEKYDPATRILTIKHDKNKEATFQINDKSDVMQGKSKADASSLGASAGQPVKVEYVMEGPNRIAEKIDVSATHAAKTMKKK